MAKTPTAWGIDVSGWQGTIDWSRVKATGCGFAVLKMGNIYNSDSGVDLESNFRRNVAECERVGMPYGVYVYTYVRTPAQMRICMSAVAAELKRTCHLMDAIPCYLDVEEQAVVAGGNRNTLDMVKVFCEAVEGAGFRAGVYTGAWWWKAYMPDTWYDTKAKWVADWSSSCDCDRPYGMWQYAETGRVDGISGQVDHNFAYFDVTGKPAPTELTDKEQTYTVKTGDTWAKVAELYKMKAVPGGIALLEYNNYKTADPALVYKVINQKTIKIPAKWLPGDLDGDGKVTAGEARKILRASAGLETLTPAERMRADVDGDGKIEAADAREALKKSAGVTE